MLEGGGVVMVVIRLIGMDGTGPKPDQWTPAMEGRLKQYLARGMDVNDITTELFHEFAKPENGYWQETYRKIQEMRLEGEIE